MNTTIKNYTYVSERINKLSTTTDQDEYFALTFDDPASLFTANLYRMNEIAFYTNKEIKESEKFKTKYNERFFQLWEQTSAILYKPSYGVPRLHRDDYPQMFRRNMSLLDDQYKTKFVDLFLANYKNFNPGAKKILATLAIDFVDKNDPRSLSILKSFSAHLKGIYLTRLLEKIDGGLENEKVKEILKSKKVLGFLKFKEEDLNDKEKRKDIIKALGKTPTLIKKLTFDVVLTLDDLNDIAPAMRFDFVKFVLKYEIIYSNRTYYRDPYVSARQNYNYYKSKNRLNRLMMPSLTTEQMKELLFAVCLKKNDDYSNWINRYDKYYNLVIKYDLLKNQGTNTVSGQC